jgi:hypothetical protein
VYVKLRSGFTFPETLQENFMSQRLFFVFCFMVAIKEFMFSVIMFSSLLSTPFRGVTGRMTKKRTRRFEAGPCNPPKWGSGEQSHILGRRMSGSLKYFVCLLHTFQIHLSIMVIGARGSVVVKALFYKSEGRGFETRLRE